MHEKSVFCFFVIIAFCIWTIGCATNNSGNPGGLVEGERINYELKERNIELGRIIDEIGVTVDRAETTIGEAGDHIEIALYRLAKLEQIIQRVTDTISRYRETKD